MWTSSRMPDSPEMAGIDRARARMAAWPVVPPVSVRMPATLIRSNASACEGRISGATMMTASSASRSFCTPSCSDSWASTRPATSRTSVRRSRR